jgi:prepilin-type N-terminal cleavage/methylation domain-containing protein
MFKIKQKQEIKGFTLIEVIVSVGIFSLVMMIALGAIISIVGANKKAQALHSVINNLNLVVESMVREMRTGFNYGCGSGDSCTEFSFDSKQITQNGSTVNVKYRFNNSKNTIEKAVESGPWLTLTSDSVIIDELKFFSVGIGNYEVEQPLVLVVIKGTALVGGKESDFNIQTLVAQRLLDL